MESMFWSIAAAVLSMALRAVEHRLAETIKEPPPQDPYLKAAEAEVEALLS